MTSKMQHLANSLGCSSGGGDDVGCSPTAAPPVLLGGSIHSLLSSCCGVYCGHQTLLNTKLLVYNLQYSGNAQAALLLDSTSWQQHSMLRHGKHLTVSALKPTAGHNHYAFLPCTRHASARL